MATQHSLYVFAACSNREAVPAPPPFPHSSVHIAVICMLHKNKHCIAVRNAAASTEHANPALASHSRACLPKPCCLQAMGLSAADLGDDVALFLQGKVASDWFTPCQGTLAQRWDLNPAMRWRWLAGWWQDSGLTHHLKCSLHNAGGSAADMALRRKESQNHG